MLLRFEPTVCMPRCGTANRLLNTMMEPCMSAQGTTFLEQTVRPVRHGHRVASGIFAPCVPRYELVLADSIEWMKRRPPNSVHAIVTDPPYGLKEFSEHEKQKLRKGQGGVWRIPPSFDGCRRSPLPRFTVLNGCERSNLESFFREFAREALRILVPGAHVFIATNPLLSHHVYIP